MAESSFQCGDSGALLKSAEEAQEHAGVKICESTEAVLDPGCTKTESDLHTKRTGPHKTSAAAQPISSEVKQGAMESEETVNIAHEGNTTLEAAINFPHGEKSPLETIQIEKKLLEDKRIEEQKAEEEKRARDQILLKLEIEKTIQIEKEEKSARDQILLKLEIEKVDRRRKLGFSPEDPATFKSSASVLNETKERILIAKQLLEAKKIEEDNERKRVSQKAEKEKRAGVKTPPIWK